MTKLGIVGAMQQEVETLLAAMQDVKKVEKLTAVFYEGKLEGLDVVVVQCGVGKVNAAMCTQSLCDCFGVTHLRGSGYRRSGGEQGCYVS